MDSTNLRERILRWEDLHTDFKERFHNDRELAKDIVCFANTDGGQLFFGVSDDRRIVGVQDVDWLLSKVDDIAYRHCEPPVTVVPQVLDVDDRKVVVVNIPKGDQRPYRTNSGNCYVRTTTGCRQASREELLRLFQAARSLYYDETPITRLNMGDLDFESLEQFLERTQQTDLGIDAERLLRNWRLMSGTHPTFAGLILFGRNPQQHLPYAQINALRIPGTDDSGEPPDLKELKCRLLGIIEQAERFISLHLKTAQYRGCRCYERRCTHSTQSSHLFPTRRCGHGNGRSERNTLNDSPCETTRGQGHTHQYKT